MTDNAPAREPILCDGCGVTDTDPKVQTGYANWRKDDRVSIQDPNFHHDCLPQEFRDIIDPDGPAAAIIAAADSGVRGDELLEFIETQAAAAAESTDNTEES